MRCAMLPDSPLPSDSCRRGRLRKHWPCIARRGNRYSEERIRILVWNIFKQQRAEWLSVLKNYAKMRIRSCCMAHRRRLNWVQLYTANYLAADQSPCFCITSIRLAFATPPAAHPVYCCSLREREPIFTFMKLKPGDLVYPFAGYPRFINGSKCSRKILVWAWTYTGSYLIGAPIVHHSGPVIWRHLMPEPPTYESRVALHVRCRCAVRFTDQRRRAFGRPLDFCFIVG